MDVTEIINRTVQRTDAYEVKYGFDAAIRYAGEMDRIDYEISKYSSFGTVATMNYAELLTKYKEEIETLLGYKQDKLTDRKSVV